MSLIYPDNPHKKEDLYANGLLDKNTYYHAGNIQIYPSSNGVDIGKVQTELNLRNVPINITDFCYVVSPNPGGYDISYNEETNLIDIQPGKCIINGFEVITNEVVSYRLPTEDEYYTGEKYDHKYKNMALLCLHTIFDSMKNISGNVLVGDVWYCEGIHVCYPTTEEYENNENEYLLLGGVDKDGNIRINDEKYTRIPAQYILIRLEPNPETGVPPEQSVNLLEFTNDYLHSYWVSKGGDHEYGNLTFRDKPKDYLNEKFKNEWEDPLNDQIYALKLGREGIDSAKDENPSYQEGYIIVKHSDNDNYPNYEKSTKYVPLGTYYKDNILDDDNSFNVFMGYTTNDETRPDYKEYTDNNNTFLTRITNKYHLQEVIGETYLYLDKQDSGSIIFDGEGFSATEDNTAQRFKIQFSPNNLYVGSIDRNLHYQNDLYSVEHSISTTFKDPSFSDYFRIDLSTVKQQITFNTKEQECYIRLRDDEQIANKETWTNVLNLGDNLEVDNNLWAKGYIVAGVKKDVVNSNDIGTNGTKGNPINNDPSLIEVPDFANVGGYRRLQPGDIYAGGQTWCAVYNDIAELFELESDMKGKEIPYGLLVATSNRELGKYCIANKHNKNVVGVISQNPALILGESKNSVPIALAGRVNVKYEGKKLKVGDKITLSNKTPGYAKKANVFTKNIYGKVVKIIDDSTVEIIVKI